MHPSIDRRGHVGTAEGPLDSSGLLLHGCLEATYGRMADRLGEPGPGPDSRTGALWICGTPDGAVAVYDRSGPGGYPEEHSTENVVHWYVAAATPAAAGWIWTALGRRIPGDIPGTLRKAPRGHVGAPAATEEDGGEW